MSRQQIDAVHEQHMTEWANLELTPEHLEDIAEAALKRATNKPKPWEEDE